MSTRKNQVNSIFNDVTESKTFRNDRFDEREISVNNRPSVVLFESGREILTLPPQSLLTRHEYDIDLQTILYHNDRWVIVSVVDAVLTTLSARSDAIDYAKTIEEKRNIFLEEINE